ncbi:transmembrane epididymal protein 1A-like [Discoglossus pictus]
MGTFIGHISPGLAFFSFAFLYAVRFSWMVLNGTREQYPPRTKTMHRRLWTSLPVEGVMKLIYSLLAVLGEFFFPPGVQKLKFFKPNDPEFHFVNPNEWQHSAMYGYFCLSGVLDIVSHSCLQQRCPLLEQVGVTFAFFVTSLLLRFHSHGKEAVEVQVHSLLLLTCTLTCVILIAEIWFPNQRKLWFTKAWLVMVQGTWLFHAAFILYRPITGHKWSSEDPANLMFLTTFYCWHLAVDAGLMCAVFWATSFYHKRWGGQLSKNDYRLAANREELEKLTGEEAL